MMIIIIIIMMMMMMMMMKIVIRNKDTRNKNKDTINTWRWMRKSDLKGCTKILIWSVQEQSIRTNYIKYNIDKTAESPLWRMCGTRNETISHTAIECGKLAQKEYKRRHDSVRRYVHWQFCEKLGVVENENFKIL